MSVLRKAKQKARQGIRAVNAERKRQFQHIRSSGGSGNPPTSHGASSQTTSFHFRQINDAFEAALDDESDLFEPQSDEQPNDPDLFATDSESDYIASGTTDEFTGDVDRHESSLFDDDLPDYNKTSVPHDETQDDLFSDDVPTISSPNGNNTVVSTVSSGCDPLSGQTVHTTLSAADSEDDPSVITNTDHVSSDLTTSGDMETVSDTQPSDVSSDVAMSVSASYDADAHNDTSSLSFGTSTSVPVSGVSQSTGTVEPDEMDDLFSDTTPGLTDHHVEELSPEPDTTTSALPGSDKETTEEIKNEKMPTEIKVEEPDKLFPDDFPTSDKYEQLYPDLSKQNKPQPNLAPPARPEYSPISPSFSPLSSLASSYEEDHFLAAHFSQPRERSPGDVSSDDQKEKRDSSTDDREGETKTHRAKPKSEHPLSSVIGSHKETDTVAALEALLAPKPNSGSGGVTDELPSQHPLEVSSTHHNNGYHLDSGVYDHDHDSFLASHSTETTDGEDMFAIQEDYFSQGGLKETSHMNSGSDPLSSNRSLEKPVGKRLTSSRSPVGSSSHTPHTTPPKRNSAGRIPPQRPQMSPNLRRKLHQPSPDPTSTDKEANQQKHLQGHLLEPATKKNRVVADDLFDNDSVAAHLPQYSTKTRPDSSVLDHPPTTSAKESLKQDTAGDHVKPQTHSQVESKLPSEDSDEPELTLTYHLLLACLLYFHYTFSSSSYLAGLLTGFLLVFLLVGSVFIYYVSTIESEKREKKNRRSRFVQPSEDFLRTMDVNFEKIKNYKSEHFTATLKYDPATHHPRQRLPAEVKLDNDFTLIVKIHGSPNATPYRVRVDIRDCTVTVVPEEVAKNRKRRWSKKFPMCITRTSDRLTVFLFSPTSREKEDWFRRLRHASDGFTSDDLIEKLNSFFGYMQDYFPAGSRQPLSRHFAAGASLPRKQKTVNRIQYSSYKENEDDLLQEDSASSISITRESGPRVSKHSRLHSPQRSSLQSKATSESGFESSVDRSSSRHASVSSVMSRSSLDENGFEYVSRPLKVTPDTLWLNALAARLSWDIWHDQRWKDWVKSRIQKKLIRVKTPSFMEQLRLTDVELGNDMPVVNRLCGGPRLDLRGIWVYLDITYEGRFVMTIETKLKSGKKESKEEQGQQMSVMKSKEDSSFPASSPHHHHTKHTKSALSHASAAKALAMGTPVDPYDNEIDSGSDDEEAAMLSHSIEDELRKQDDTQEKEEQTSSSRLKSVVMRIGKRVANTRIVRKAVEKVSSYPLVLTVVVNRLDGILAVNIPPPTTDTIWFGFTKSPRLELVAKPKLGQREVKLSAVTLWIEKKLREVVDKKLVLPEMEDLVIPILNSGLPEDKQKQLVTDNEQTT